jgi:pimeloyl-ACP methyl ester carboxylesterase
METIKDNLAIYQHGKPENLPLVFVHGFPYDHRMWDAQINKFQSNYYCITYDIRGLGESPARGGQFTMEDLADDLLKLIEDMNLNKPVVCGLSMGGYITLRAVEKDESKFGGIILCDTKSAADTNAAKLNRAGGIRKIDEHGVKKFTADFIANCFAEESIERLGAEYQEIVNWAAGCDPVGLKACLLAMAGRTDTTSYLSKLKIPALLMCGEKDNLTPPEVMKAMAEEIGKKSFSVIPHSGHVTSVENQEAFNMAVLNYLLKYFS